MTNVLPLEETDPELAKHIQDIVAGNHSVRSFASIGNARIYRLHSGQIIRRTTEPYSPCPCGSGKKFKHCCRPA